MKYPKFISKNSTIGIVAPSAGVADRKKILLESAIKNFESKGHKVILSPSVLKFEKCVSAPPEVRAKEFMDFYLDDSIDAIISVAGGEFMQEILPYIDFDKIKNAKPKFFQGMSDNTNLTLTLTTLCDIASIYGDCFGHFGRNPHKVLKNQYDFLLGKNQPVKSNSKYQITDSSKEEGHELDGYNCTEKVEWKILSGEKQVEFKGRLIGGCMDIIQNIIGTKQDAMLDFCERYKKDGIIWFIESCDLTVLDQYRFWWKMREIGMFKYCKGIIIGRPAHTEMLRDINYEYANYHNLKDLNIPVVIDCDFGHMHPCFHIVSGAIGKVKCAKGKGSIEYILK